MPLNRRLKHLKSITFTAALGVSSALTVAIAADPAPLDARAAGARHGQALGVALVCYGLKTTPAVEKLPSAYSGDDLKAFNQESEKVLLSWQKAKSCVKAGGPNECRLIFEWSCREALIEIGPEGTKLKGLVETAH